MAVSPFSRTIKSSGTSWRASPVAITYSCRTKRWRRWSKICTPSWSWFSWKKTRQRTTLCWRTWRGSMTTWHTETAASWRATRCAASIVNWCKYPLTRPPNWLTLNFTYLHPGLACNTSAWRESTSATLKFLWVQTGENHRHAILSFKCFQTNLTALWRYMYHMYQLDAFTQSCPADQDIINHYKLQQVR